ncbi:MAG: acylphosphatase [Dehalococcoidia bacterium]
MNPDASLFAIVHGRVQGVNFRAFVQQRARSLGIEGYVRNLPEGRSVELRAEGERNNLEELERNLHVGPPGARVERVDTEWSKYTGEFTDFKVRF